MSHRSHFFDVFVCANDRLSISGVYVTVFALTFIVCAFTHMYNMCVLYAFMNVYYTCNYNYMVHGRATHIFHWPSICQLAILPMTTKLVDNHTAQMWQACHMQVDDVVSMDDVLLCQPQAGTNLSWTSLCLRLRQQPLTAATTA